MTDMPQLSIPIPSSLLVQTLEQRDPDVFRHGQRVGQVAGLIGARLGLTQEELRILRTAGELHDIGKLAIPSFLVHKEGVFTETEYLIFKHHSGLGGAILEEHHQPLELAHAALHHHERWDGRGYPHGLRGEEIPLFARIVTVADAYDAMISGRTYRSLLGHAEALEEIGRCCGGQFCPEVVEAFLAAPFRAEVMRAG
mgnify:CR=1 FL=1